MNYWFPSGTKIFDDCVHLGTCVVRLPTMLSKLPHGIRHDQPRPGILGRPFRTHTLDDEPVDTSLILHFRIREVQLVQLELFYR